MDQYAQVLSQLPAIHQQLLSEAWFEWISERDAASQNVQVASDEISESFRNLPEVR